MSPVVVNRPTDIAIKTTSVKPGMQIIERHWSMLEIQLRSQAEVRAVGAAILAEIGAAETTVLILDEGTSARQVLGAPRAPIRTVIVGIVDSVTGDDSGTPRAITETAATKEPHPKEPRRRRHGGTRSDADHA